MGKPLNDKLNELPVTRRKRILAEADRLHAEYLTLQELRKAKRLTQTQVEFPDRVPVSLEGFGDTEEPPRKQKIL